MVYKVNDSGFNTYTQTLMHTILGCLVHGFYLFVVGFGFFLFCFVLFFVFCLLTLQRFHCLVGLVVKASTSRAEDPGFESCLHRDFFWGVESYH